MYRARPAIGRAHYKSFRLRAQERDRNFRSERRQFFPFEGRHDDVSLEPPLEDQCLGVLRDIGIFQFNIEQAPAPEFIQHLAQQWDRLIESGIELPELFIGEIPDTAPSIRGSV